MNPRMTTASQAADAGTVARELEAMALLARLKAEGFMVVIIGGQLVVAPDTRLSPADGADVKRLSTELVHLVNEGDDGELVPLPADIAAWLDGQSPLGQATYHHLVRVRQRMCGGGLQAVRRFVYDYKRTHQTEK